jgi:AcrR family transcriptional regulator
MQDATKDGRLARGASTRDALVAAGRAVLVEEGFARASARTIAARAGCSQAALFYHFPTVGDLLLAVLDEVSGRRDRTYREAIETARGRRALLRVAREIHRGDLDSGDTRVLVELVAGARTVEGMSAQVLLRLEPWERIAADVMARVVPRPFRSRLDARVAGHGLAALFLGLELLGSLRPPDDPAPDVLGRLAALAGGAS